MKRPFLRSACLLFIFLMAYCSPGWCPCSECVQDKDGFWHCSSPNCAFYLPRTDEESIWSRQQLQKESRLQELRRTQDFHGRQLVEARRRRQETVARRRRQKQETVAWCRRQEQETVTQRRKQTAEKHSCRVQKVQEQLGTVQISQSSEALEKLYQRMLNEHETFWGVMIRAMRNYWKFHDISVDKSVMPAQIMRTVRNRQGNVPGCREQNRPNNRPPELLFWVYNHFACFDHDNPAAESAVQLHDLLLAEGFVFQKYQIISERHLVKQIHTYLAEHPGTLVIMVYDCAGENETRAHHLFVFQLNDHGQIFCFSNAEGGLKQMTMVPDIFELVYLSFYNFDPKNKDQLTLTLYYPLQEEGQSDEDENMLDDLPPPEDIADGATGSSVDIESLQVLQARGHLVHILDQAKATWNW